MPSAYYYRTEAERCRRLARMDAQASAADRLRKMASDYDELALCFEATDRSEAATESFPVPNASTSSLSSRRARPRT